VTELLKKELSRKSFLAGGGALVVGLSLAGRARAADSPFASNAPYDPNAIDSWIVIHAVDTATV
jgi:hypothetical protein